MVAPPAVDAGEMEAKATSLTSAICVLGMHRSGTSCLTGLLEDAGVYLGGVSKNNPHNRKGNQENVRIMHLHDAVLAANGGSWDQPPSRLVVWSDEQRGTLRSIIEEYRDKPLWAFKDPRSLFTLDGWRQALPELQFIGTFRHPSVVAQSLYRRGKSSPEDGFGLWLKYNQRLLDYQRAIGFDVLCFDLDPADYLEAAVHAFHRFGLLVDPGALHFYDEGLRSRQADSQFDAPSAEVLDVYAQLKEISI